jgi:hypothetical protein
MNRDYYCAAFGRISVNEEMQRLQRREQGFIEEMIPDTIRYQVTRIEDKGFEPPVPEGYQPFYDLSHAHTGEGSLKLSKEKPFSRGFGRQIGDLTGKGANWIRVTGWFMYNSPNYDENLNLVITCNHNGTAYKYFIKSLANTGKPGIWNRVTTDYKIPDDFPDKTDEVQAYFWNTGDQVCFIDDFSVDLFEPLQR